MASSRSRAPKVAPERPVPVEALSCARCGSPRVTTLALTLDSGVPVDFTSCQVCEHKTWRGPSGILPLESFKEAAAEAAAGRRSRRGGTPPA